ncbi:hypothetical protein [Streptomyces sp. H27-C3]|uniref:hypothetical protein n=1 Tax=Streptomyces sp. H27-C3 TaxID=3046305 RepID=UPI0024BB2F71|nr:hypothetical protein [Streptomyces sp. H27-C3]MDJ0463677.1 hypothetical protein [Streptomyces sp. H27-C3]
MDTYPYSCDYVGGPTVRRIGGRPTRGEDSLLVRPYLVAHERRLAEEAQGRGAAEGRQRRVLWLAVRGVEFGGQALEETLSVSRAVRLPVINSVRTGKNPRAEAVA